jgi:predicted RNA binding protein YcfA (HicA-like mRNA interferase family)
LSKLPEFPARRVLRALQRAGFNEVRRKGSHRFLAHADGRVLLFAHHESERLGPKILAKILRDAGLNPEELRAVL